MVYRWYALVFGFPDQNQRANQIGDYIVCIINAFVLENSFFYGKTGKE